MVFIDYYYYVQGVIKQCVQQFRDKLHEIEMYEKIQKRRTNGMNGVRWEHTNLRAREIISSGRPLTKYQLVSRTKVLVRALCMKRKEKKERRVQRPILS